MADTKNSANSDIWVLIVDDDENLCKVLSMAVSSQGYNVNYFLDSQEALQKIRSYKYQIVLSDIKMPNMHGVDLLREIRKVSSIIQVIMLTGYSSLEIALDCMEAGAVDFLFKPFEDLEEIYTAIEESAKKVRRWRRISVKAGKISRLDAFNLLDV